MGLLKRATGRLNLVLRTQFGIDVRLFLSGFASLPRYTTDWWRFRRSLAAEKLDAPMRPLPALHDRVAQAGSLHEYFWQDLFVARLILAAAPRRHIDVGSRIDGFVANVAASRSIEIIDIRPIETQIPNVRFLRADMMVAPPPELIAACDSLSCLHTIEHFGLGRYGDPIDAAGMATGIGNLSKMLRDGGLLYLSTPVGKERVEFNAHRVSDPRKVVDMGAKHGLQLQKFASIEGDGIIEHDDVSAALALLAGKHYALGIFMFTKAAG